MSSLSHTLLSRHLLLHRTIAQILRHRSRGTTCSSQCLAQEEVSHLTVFFKSRWDRMSSFSRQFGVACSEFLTTWCKSTWLRRGVFSACRPAQLSYTSFGRECRRKNTKHLLSWRSYASDGSSGMSGSGFTVPSVMTSLCAGTLRSESVGLSISGRGRRTLPMSLAQHRDVGTATMDTRLLVSSGNPSPSFTDSSCFRWASKIPGKLVALSMTSHLECSGLPFRASEFQC